MKILEYNGQSLVAMHCGYHFSVEKINVDLGDGYIKSCWETCITNPVGYAHVRRWKKSRSVRECFCAACEDAGIEMPGEWPESVYEAKNELLSKSELESRIKKNHATVWQLLRNINIAIEDEDYAFGHEQALNLKSCAGGLVAMFEEMGRREDE